MLQLTLTIGWLYVRTKSWLIKYVGIKSQMADEIQREKMLCYENHTQSNSQLQFTYKLNNSNLQETANHAAI